MNDTNRDVDALTPKPYTVSAVYEDGLESLIKHVYAADAQAARDQVIMDMGGKVIIASVFAGHLSEPDSLVFRAEETYEPDEEEAAGTFM